MEQPARGVESAGGQIKAIVCFKFEDDAASISVPLLERVFTDSKNVAKVMDLEGSFNLMLEASYPDLEQCNADLERIRASCGRSLVRFEANLLFQCLERPIGDDSPDKYIRSLKLPCKYGSKKIEISLVERLVAEGDYVRVVFCGQQDLLHATLSELELKLDPSAFIRVHRSVILNRSMIERVCHKGRRWQVRLRDGTSQNVSRGHIPQLLAMIGRA